ncbi:MAG: hypothetical protein M0D55_15425 [Elusimicrobiota bacterium]|nr:MAG: hypothetical protein M0D55_15425 [Elusimicrobiota bacterium]
MNPNEQRPVTEGFLRDALRDFATKNDIEAMLLPIRALLVKHSEELSEIRTHIREKLVTKDEFHHRMDAFAGRLVDEDYRAAKSRARLDDHETRITALEKRSS